MIKKFILALIMGKYLISFLLVIVGFNAKAQLNAFFNNNHVEIYWSYSDIKDINHYVIEKSRNGKTFKEYMTIRGKDVPFNNFMETDFTPYKKITYYRIRYVLRDGKSYFSQSIAVKKHLQNKNTLLNYDKINVLVVMKTKAGKLKHTKLNIKEKDGELYSETFNDNIRTGIYTIIASSDDSIVGFFLKVNNIDQNNANPNDSLEIPNKE